MAGVSVKYGNQYNQPLREYVVTNEDEISDLPTSTTAAKGKFKDDVNFQSKPAIGSSCKVIASDGSVYFYFLRENGWVKRKNSSGGSSSGEVDFEFTTNDDIDQMFK